MIGPITVASSNSVSRIVESLVIVDRLSILACIFLIIVDFLVIVEILRRTDESRYNYLAPFYAF